MFKISLLSTFLLWFSFTGTAQFNFMHGLGVGLEVFKGEDINQAIELSIYGAASYNARFVFLQISETASLGVQATPFGGHSIGEIDHTGYNKGGPFGGIQLGPEFSFGALATLDADEGIGIGISPSYTLGMSASTGTYTAMGGNLALRIFTGDNPFGFTINYNSILHSTDQKRDQSFGLKFIYYMGMD
jgi:hypothetical protein